MDNQQPTDLNVVQPELDRLGVKKQFPLSTINGVKLTDNQYKAYIAVSGGIAKNLLAHLISSDGWSKVSDDDKPSLIKAVINKAETTAQSVIMMHSANTDNDILRQSLQNKLQNQGKQPQEEQLL